MTDHSFTFNDLIEQSRLEKILKRFCTTIDMGCCIVDASGAILIEQFWSCSGKCHLIDRAKQLSAYQLESFVLAADEMRAEVTDYLLTCKNKISAIGIPIQIEGVHIATIFIGPFILDNRPDSSAKQNEQEVVLCQSGELVTLREFSENRIRLIFDHLKLLVDIIVEMGTNQLQQKKVNRELSISAERYRTLFESSHDALILVKNDVIIDCNKKAADLFLQSKTSLVNQYLPQIVDFYTASDSPSSNDFTRNCLQKTLAVNKAYKWDIFRADASIIETELVIKMLELEQKMFLMTLKNVTQQNKHKRDLEIKESAWQALFQHAPFGIAINRLRDGVYLDVNPALEQSTGRSSKEIIGKASNLFSVTLTAGSCRAGSCQTS